MAEWTEVALGTCFVLGREKSPATKVDACTPFVGMEHIDPGIPYIKAPGQASDVTGIVSKFSAGATLFGRLRAYLRKVALADFDGVCSTEVLVLTPTSRIDKRYLCYVASSEGCIEYCVQRSAGSRMPRTSVDDLAAFRFRLPPLTEQHRIVAVISAVDDQVEALRGELDAARRLTSRLRNEAFSGLSDRSTVRADVMFDMLLGRQKSERQSVGDHVIPYLRSGNIADNGLKLDEVLRMNFDPREQEKYGLQRDDILLAEGGTIGNVARWMGDIPGVVGFDKHVIRLRSKTGRSLPEYALHWSHWCRESGAFDATATGITIKALGFGRASSMPVADLDEDEQRALTVPLESASHVVDRLAAELVALRRLRSDLLAALLSGEMTVDEAVDRFTDKAA